MPNARHHQSKAEELLAFVDGLDMDLPLERDAALIALGKAQVHATLAVSAESVATIDSMRQTLNALQAKVDTAARKGYVAGATTRRPY